MPLLMRTNTFLRPPPGPTMTSSSRIGVLAQNGSPPRLSIFISGALPVSVTVPFTVAVPAFIGAAGAAAAAPSACAAGGGVAGAAAGGGAGAAGGGAGGSLFGQPAAVKLASASARSENGRRCEGLIMPACYKRIPSASSIHHAADRLHEPVEPLRRGREVAAHAQLAVDQHQVLAVEDLE